MDRSSGEQWLQGQLSQIESIWFQSGKQSPPPPPIPSHPQSRPTIQSAKEGNQEHRQPKEEGGRILNLHFWIRFGGRKGISPKHIAPLREMVMTGRTDSSTTHEGVCAIVLLGHLPKIWGSCGEVCNGLGPYPQTPISTSSHVGNTKVHSNTLPMFE